MADVEKAEGDICPKHGPYSTPHCRECDLDIIANVESEEPIMPSEMVERCARAIGDQMAADANSNEDIARAVLEALREPTEEMLNALGGECLKWAPGAWSTMIDTALKDTP